MKYAVKHNIKFIINVGLSYNFIEVLVNRPNFIRSFGFGGMTVLYPPLLNINLMIGFEKLIPYLSRTKVLVNTALGLEAAITLPTNYVFTGLLSNRSVKTL